MTPGTNNSLSLHRLGRSGGTHVYGVTPYATVDCYLERTSETREALLGPVPGYERWYAVCDPCGVREGDRAYDQDGVEYRVDSVRSSASNTDCDGSCQIGLLRKTSTD